MYNKLTLHGDLNVNYAWVKTEECEVVATSLEKPVWDGHTTALANFKTDSSASSYEGGNFSFSKYKVYRWDKSTDKLKYIATITNDKVALKDYTNPSGNASKYLIYPIKDTEDGGEMGVIIETLQVTPKYNAWTIAGIHESDEDGVYYVDKDATWKFWLSPEIASFSQVTNKEIKTGYNRYPTVKYSDVNYTTGSMKFYLGDLDCDDYEYIGDDVFKKNLWLEFANSPTPKILTDPKGECMIVDITPKEVEVDYTLVEMPTMISFEFTQLDSADNISVCGEGDE